MNPAFFERNSPNKMEPNFHKIQWIKIQIEKIHSNKSVCRNLLAQQNPNHFCCSEIQEGISTGRSLSFGSDPPCSFWSCLKPWALSRYFPTLKPPQKPKKRLQKWHFFATNHSPLQMLEMNTVPVVFLQPCSSCFCCRLQSLNLSVCSGVLCSAFLQTL